jgi:predicted acyl esterase
VKSLRSLDGDQARFSFHKSHHYENRNLLDRTSRDAHEHLSANWRRPLLENIEVPALICASWADHGLHTRGSIEGFERISSRQRWSFTHRRKKWDVFYGDEALASHKAGPAHPEQFAQTPSICLGTLIEELVNRITKNRSLIR